MNDEILQREVTLILGRDMQLAESRVEQLRVALDEVQDRDNIKFNV